MGFRNSGTGTEDILITRSVRWPPKGTAVEKCPPPESSKREITRSTTHDHEATIRIQGRLAAPDVHDRGEETVGWQRESSCGHNTFRGVADTSPPVRKRTGTTTASATRDIDQGARATITILVNPRRPRRTPACNTVKVQPAAALATSKIRQVHVRRFRIPWRGRRTTSGPIPCRVTSSSGHPVF